MIKDTCDLYVSINMYHFQNCLKIMCHLFTLGTSKYWLLTCKKWPSSVSNIVFKLKGETFYHLNFSFFHAFFILFSYFFHGFSYLITQSFLNFWNNDYVLPAKHSPLNMLFFHFSHLSFRLKNLRSWYEGNNLESRLCYWNIWLTWLWMPLAKTNYIPWTQKLRIQWNILYAGKNHK